MTRAAPTRWLASRPAWQAHAGGAALVLLLGLAAYLLEFGPLMSQDRQRADLRARSDAHRARLRQLTADVKAARDQAAAAERYVAAAALSLRPRSHMNKRLAALTELAGACGLQADTIEPGADTPGPRYTTVSIHMTARGTAAQVARFLDELRRRMPDDPALAVEMAAPPGVAGDPVGVISFDLQWFTSGDSGLASN